ncbi:MAG: hypothetical protein DRP09_18150, partial [Candidatus Thorarchaeota archaeon]
MNQLGVGDDCTHYIEFYAVDCLGNTEAVQNQTVHVDNTPPELIKVVGQPHIYGGQDQYGHDIWWVTDQTEINLSMIDREAPCAVGGGHIYYRIWFLGNWSDWTEYVGNFTFNEHCTHYLEVNASDCLGNYIIDNETFIVHAEIGEHPTLVSPECGSVLDDNTPTLVWNPVPNKDNYRVEWSTDITFATFEYSNVTGTQYTLPPLVDGKYYWRVAIIYTSGSVGQWSDVWWFTIDTTGPVIESVVTDHNNNTVVVGDDILITVTEASRETGLTGWLVIDGAQYGLIDNSDGTYSYTWNVPEWQIPNDYVVEATLEDAIGHSDYNNSLVITVVAGTGPDSHILDITPNPTEDNPTLIAEFASDEALLAGAEYKIDWTGTPIAIPGNWLDSPPWDSTYESLEHEINISGLEHGEHTLFLRAMDEYNRWGAWDEEEFTISDTEDPKFDPLNLDDWYSGIMTITVTNPAPDTWYVLFEYSPDEGTTWYPIVTDFTEPFEAQWNTAMAPDGVDYQIKVTAYDYSFNSYSRRDTNIYIDNSDPIVNITSPDDFATVYGIIDITYTADDGLGIGIMSEEIKIDDGIWTPSSSPVIWDTTTVDDGLHQISVRATDGLGNIGQDVIMVLVDNDDESDPHIFILEPEQNETRSDHILKVKIDAWDDKTAKEDLNVRLWIPGGRRDAPTLWYDVEYNVTDGYFYAYVDIYKYQSGANITLCADATDEANNYEPAPPVAFMVESTIVYDKWMQDGWNSLTLPPAGIACDQSVESVLASIDGAYDWVWWYNHDTGIWDFYKYNVGGSLSEMDTGEEYWIHMNGTGMRYYTDTTPPYVTIEYPVDESIINSFETDIWGTASDIETDVTEVWISLYDNTTGEYWTGSGWDSIYTELLCNGSETWNYENTSSIDMTGRSGHEFIVLAIATDMAGCDGYDVISFIYDDTDPAAFIDPIAEYVNTAPDITGGSTDNFMLDYVEVQLTYNDGNDHYWDFETQTLTSNEKWKENHQTGTYDTWDLTASDPTSIDYT